MEVLYLTLVIFALKIQIFHVSSFTNPCESSLATIDFVERCPNDTDSYIKASARKNCSARQHNCTSFEYHCVLNDWKNATIEVCAPSIRIIGSVCTEFDVGLKSIFRMDGTNCGDAPSCPFSYNSTEAYKYSGCYRLVTYSTTPVNPSQEGSGYSTTEEIRQTSKESSLSTRAQAGIVGGVLAAIIIVVILGVLIFCLKRKGKWCNCGRKPPIHNPDETVPMNIPQGGGSGTDGPVPRNDASATDGPIQEIDDKISRLHDTYKPAYMAYKTKNIRQKSFDSCYNFLKDKSNEFAEAGFYYKGYDKVVVCYHCGKEGAEWTEKDTGKDIIKKHYKLNEECKYIEILSNHRRKK